MNTSLCVNCSVYMKNTSNSTALEIQSSKTLGFSHEFIRKWYFCRNYLLGKAIFAKKALPAEVRISRQAVTVMKIRMKVSSESWSLLFHASLAMVGCQCLLLFPFHCGWTGLARGVKHLTKARQFSLYLPCFVPQLRELSWFCLRPHSSGEVWAEWVWASSENPCWGVGTSLKRWILMTSV